MMQWCVVRYDERRIKGVRYDDGTSLRRQMNPELTGIYSAEWMREEQRCISIWDRALSPDQQLFFVDTEAEADHLMTELAKANPGIEYGKCKVQRVVTTTISKPVFSKYSEKGLLPE